MEENKIVEEKLSMLMDDKPFTEAEHDHFAKLLSNELKTFILARRGDLVVSKLPNKGKIADAIRGDKNLISLAFSCRVVSVILDSKLKEAEESEGNIGSVTEDERHTFLRHEVIVCIKNISTKASTYIMNEDWISLVRTVFDPTSTNMINIVSKECCDKADVLQKTLLSRLTNHIRRRITDKKKMEHWSLQWAAKNLSQMAALMVLFKHVKDDINCLDDNATLLNTPIFFVKVAGDESNKQGAYLHYDNNDGCWIRSGKVTGRGLKVKRQRRNNPRLHFTYAIRRNAVRGQILQAEKDSSII